MTRVLIQGDVYGFQSVGGINRSMDEWMSRIDATCPDIELMVKLPDHPLSRPPPLTRGRVLCNWRGEGMLAPVQRWVNARRLRNFRPQVFHSSYYAPAPVPGARTVVTVYDFVDDHSFRGMSGNSAGFMERRRKAIEGADLVVAISEATKQDIVRYTRAREDRIRVIWPSCNERMHPADEAAMAGLRERHGLTKPFWLYVGHRELYKNFSTLLRAWAALQAGGGDTQLVVVGRADRLESWQVDFLIRHRLDDRLVMLSAADDATLSAAYSAAAALVYPSICEGFGIPLVEAMGCGCPLLVSDIPVFHEVAGDSALYFDPRDAAALTGRMRELRAAGGRERLRGLGRERRRLFSWDTSAAKLADVYRELA
jgi:alpha-1,3-rhamnosyl/mannosyltransferase